MSVKCSGPDPLSQNIKSQKIDDRHNRQQDIDNQQTSYDE